MSSKHKNTTPVLVTQRPFYTDWRFWLLFGLLALVFSNVYHAQFVNYDDNILIYQNPIVFNENIFAFPWAFTNHFGSPNYKPITYLSWILESSIFGLSPKVIHINNLLLHIANSYLVFKIVDKILKKTGWEVAKIGHLPFMVAALWALHPMKVESVAWAVERKDVLYSFFYLLGIKAYLGFMENRLMRQFGWAVGFYFLSIGSKSMGITLPAIWLLMEWYFGEKWLFGRLAKHKYWIIGFGVILMFLVFQVYGLTKIFSQIAGEGKQPAPISNMLPIVQLVSLFLFRWSFFVGHLFAPLHLSIVYPKTSILPAFGMAYWLAVALPILSFLGAFFSKNRNLLFSLWAFTIIISPALIVETEGNNFLSDRYTYMASLPICFMVLVGLHKWLNNRVLLLLAALVGVLMGVATFQRSKVWENSKALFSDLVAKFPDSPVGYNNLGQLMYEMKAPDAAMTYYQQALGKDPMYEQGLLNRGQIYLERRMDSLAIADYQNALKVNPQSSFAYTGLGSVKGNQGKYDEALILLDKAIELDPYNPTAYRIKAIILNVQGKVDQAILSINEWLRFEPEHPQAYYMRASYYFVMGELIKASDDIDKSLESAPLNPEYQALRRRISRGK